MNRTDPQFKLRIPAELKDQLELGSEQNMRSLSNEILKRLEVTLMLDELKPPLRGGFAGAPEVLSVLLTENENLRRERDHFEKIISESFSEIIEDRLGKLATEARAAQYQTETIQYLCAVLALQCAHPDVISDLQRREILKVVQHITGSDSQDPGEIMGLLTNRLIGRTFGEVLGI